MAYPRGGNHAPAPPRKKGQLPPALAAVAADPATIWTSIIVAQWYGAGACEVEVATDTAVWYHTGLPPVPLRWVLIRDPRDKFATQVLLCTDQDAAPEQVLTWFVLRWQLEVTPEDARRHLGVETQRQWSECALRRTTLAMLGLFSLVILLAHARMADPAAWYRNERPTFADALALVRRKLWHHQTFHTSSCDQEIIKV